MLIINTKNIISFTKHQPFRSVFTTFRAHAEAVAIPHKPGPHPPIENTFHRKPLPKTLISFTSNQGKIMFRNSLAEGFAEGYFSLAGNFTPQVEPAYCGPSSLAMALNALEVDPMKQWKGAWRWYNEEIILQDACLPKDYVSKKGITYGQFSCLARKHCQVTSKRANTTTLEDFRSDIRNACSSSDSFLVTSFSRKDLGQTGSGHFSPIGAYNSENDAVLVLDVARFKYPSYFVTVPDLFRAMQSIDKETGQPRGYFILKALPKPEGSLSAPRPPGPHSCARSYDSIYGLQVNRLSRNRYFSHKETQFPKTDKILVKYHKCYRKIHYSSLYRKRMMQQDQLPYRFLLDLKVSDRAGHIS